MHLRKARSDDLAFLWDLRNQPSVRANFFNDDVVAWEAHSKWFKEKIVDKNCLLLIAEHDGARVGQVRFDVKAGESSAEVSMAVSEARRGQGYGTAMLKSACPQAFAELGVTKLVAHIKPDNNASLAAFGKAGFALKGQVDYQARVCLEMVLEKPAVTNH